MKIYKGLVKLWVLAILLVVVVAGCGNNDSTDQNAAKGISTFSLNGSSGSINETAKTISVTVPNGTSVTALVATFTTTGSSVTVGTVVQTSGTTPNNFTAPPVYTVTAIDGTTVTYTVLVTVAPLTTKAITTFSLAGAAGTVNETAKTITVTVPNGTALTALAATFTTTGSTVKVGSAVQTSGTTPNNFSSPVAYIVTAADGTAATYTVTVVVAAGSAKVITAYSLDGITGTINSVSRTIAVAVPNGTNLSAMIATFTTTGAGVLKGTTAQVSGVTPNNFTTPVTYTVTAADSTSVTYVVTVTPATPAAAKGPAAVNLGTAANYVILAETLITTTGTTAVTGDLGISPAAATFIQGFSLTLDPSGNFSKTTPSTLVTGNVYAADYNTGNGGIPAKLTTAIADMMIAYTDAAGRPTPDFNELYTGDISGKTLVPGLYKWGTGVLVTSDVTLNGGPNDVWIFQVAQDVTVGNGVSVKLTGGALAKNVFWQVAGGTGVTIGTTAHMEGIVMAIKAISLDTGASATGRLLSQTAVTLKASTVTAP